MDASKTKIDSLVQRLRDEALRHDGCGEYHSAIRLRAAADEIELLQARKRVQADELTRLREMNSNLTDKANHYLVRNARIEEENACLRAEILARNAGWAEIQIGRNK